MGSPTSLTAAGHGSAKHGARRRLARGATICAHMLAAAVVVIGVAVQIARPLAPDLGPPPDPGTWFDPAHLARVEAYQGPRYAASLAALLLRIAVPCLIAFTPVGRRLVDWLARRLPGRPVLLAAATGLVVVVVTDLVVLPVAFWVGFIHEGAYGFRTQGVGGWLVDRAIAVVPVWLLVAVLLALGRVLIRRLPRAWPPVAGLCATLLTSALVYLSPLVLEPLRFNLTPLPAGAVRDTVTTILDRADMDVERLLVADASRRTTKQNAYVSGLGDTRHVVLYDTLITGQSAEEVGLVFAHELGHDLNDDLARGTLFAGAGTIVTVYVIAWALRRPHFPSGGGGSTGRDAAVAVAVVAMLTAASLPLQSLTSRRAEAAADLAALDLTRDPGTYLSMNETLARANLSDPDPPWWVHVLWSSHPPAAARLEMGRRWPFEQPMS